MRTRTHIHTHLQQLEERARRHLPTAAAGRRHLNNMAPYRIKRGAIVKIKVRKRGREHAKRRATRRAQRARRRGQGGGAGQKRAVAPMQRGELV